MRKLRLGGSGLLLTLSVKLILPLYVLSASEANLELPAVAQCIPTADPTASFSFRSLTSALCPGRPALKQFLCLLLPRLTVPQAAGDPVPAQTALRWPLPWGPMPPWVLTDHADCAPEARACSSSLKGSLPAQWLTAHIHLLPRLPDPCHLLCNAFSIFL